MLREHLAIAMRSSGSELPPLSVSLIVTLLVVPTVIVTNVLVVSMLLQQEIPVMVLVVVLEHYHHHLLPLLPQLCLLRFDFSKRRNVSTVILHTKRPILPVRYPGKPHL